MMDRLFNCDLQTDSKILIFHKINNQIMNKHLQIKKIRVLVLIAISRRANYRHAYIYIIVTIID